MTKLSNQIEEKIPEISSLKFANKKNKVDFYLLWYKFISTDPSDIDTIKTHLESLCILWQEHPENEVIKNPGLQSFIDQQDEQESLDL